jgi:hypothetical protein
VPGHRVARDGDSGDSRFQQPRSLAVVVVQDFVVAAAALPINAGRSVGWLIPPRASEVAKPLEGGVKARKGTVLVEVD